jgi:hypothetical protein
VGAALLRHAQLWGSQGASAPLKRKNKTEKRKKQKTSIPSLFFGRGKVDARADPPQGIHFSNSNMAACLGFTVEAKPCRNVRRTDWYFCNMHDTLGSHALKNRWIFRYFTRARFVVTKDGAFESRVLEPLRLGFFTLTKKDFDESSGFTPSDALIDIYIVLVKHGFIEIDVSPTMYHLCAVYPLQMWNLFAMTPNLIIPRHTQPLLVCIEETLICKDGRTMSRFMEHLISRRNSLVYLRRHCIFKYLLCLLRTPAGAEYIWSKDTISRPWGSHQATDFEVFMDKEFLVAIESELSTQKRYRRLRSEIFKEELMQNRWHPDRVQHYFDLGLDIDDM